MKTQSKITMNEEKTELSTSKAVSDKEALPKVAEKSNLARKTEVLRAKAAAKPAAKSVKSAALKAKAAPRKGVVAKKSNISPKATVKPASAPKTGETKKPETPLRYAVSTGRTVADELIRANRGVCLTCLDTVEKIRDGGFGKFPLVSELGQEADRFARGLVESGTDNAYSAVRQLAKVADASLSRIEEVLGDSMPMLSSKKSLPFTGLVDQLTKVADRVTR